MVSMALEGVKVVCLSWALAGPLTSKNLSDFGATVIRVESNLRPDPFRVGAPQKDGITGVDRGGIYAYTNPNKYDITINLTDPRGLELLKKLIAWGDVFVDGFVPGIMEGWGLGYDNVKEINPSIIFLRTSVQGQTGPHSKMRAWGYNLTSLTGFVDLTGWPDREPVQPYGAYTDFISPPFATAAILAALDHRRRTGEGQCIDLSQFETCIQLISPLLLNYQVNHADSSRAGNACAYASPHGAYRCLGDDRWCAIAVFSDQQWLDFCEATGHSEWVNDSRFETLLARKSNEAELNKLVEEWTVGHEAEDVMALLQKAGIPAGVVKSPEEVYNDPQLKHREAFWMLNHRVLGNFPHLGQPCLLSETPASGRTASPCLGQHTEFVCREILGLPDEEFVQLLVDKVLD